MRGTTIATLVAAVALVAAGCGGSGKPSAAPATTTAAATTATTAAATTTGTTATTAPATTATTAAAPTTTGGSSTTPAATTGTAGATNLPAGISKDCADLVNLGAQYSQALAAAGASAQGGDLQKETQAFQALAGHVPAEIRSEFQTIAAAFVKYADALKGLQLKPGQTPSADTLQKLAAAAKALETPEVKAATLKIEAWVKTKCPQG